MTDLEDRFRRAAETAQSDVRSVGSLDELVGWLAEAAGAGPLVVAPAMAAAQPALLDGLADRGVPAIVPDAATAPTDVADAAIGVVAGSLAVAETGSVLVDEHAVPDRLVTLLVRHLVQVVAADDVVASLDDVADWLAERAGRPGFASLMTGPSRSADIERSLSIGVQGPERITVVLVR